MKQKGASTSFNNRKPFFNSSAAYFDTEGLYENGKANKRKRSDDDDYSDDDDNKSFDPNSYNSKMAKFRTNLIKSELTKRKMNQSMDIDDFKTNNEELQLAEVSKLKEPLNKKLANLTLKSRENWFKKMVQVLEENSKGNAENKETDMCVEFEHDILIKSKNLSIYQANCMRKISEIKKFTKENKYYIDYYNEQQNQLLEAKEQEQAEDKNKIINKLESDKALNDSSSTIKAFSSTFTSALTLFNDKTESDKVIPKLENLSFSKNEDYQPIFPVKKEVIKVEPIKKEPKLVLSNNIVKCNLTLNDVSQIVVADLSKVYKEGKFLNKVSS
jgi:hypothetical protein